MGVYLIGVYLIGVYCQTCRLYSPVRIGSAGQVPGGEVTSGGKVASGAKTASGSKAARVYIDVHFFSR
jgi:hypothetical protein